MAYTHLNRDFESKRSGSGWIRSLLFKTKFRTFLFSLWILFFLYCGYYYFLISSMQLSEKVTRATVIDKTPTPEEPVVNNNIEDLKPNEDQETNTVPPSTKSNYAIPVLIFTYKRAEYLKETLDTIFKYLPQTGFDIYVSQDDFDARVKETVDSYGSKIKKHFQRERRVEIPDKVSTVVAYYSIAQHYKFGIDKVFEQDTAYDRIIILEEDLKVAPDFFQYMNKMSPLLDRDTSVFCISAWNDNGLREFVSSSSTFYRSDFFPGLGWMMKRSLWTDDIGPKWPLGFWDDWLREGVNRKGRACIRPEISRTFTFGFKGGASSNQFSQYLSRIQLNDGEVDWESIDVNDFIKSKYDAKFIEEVRSAKLLSVGDLDAPRENEKIRVEYHSNDNYMDIARKIGIMADVKAGVPRGAYLGTVTVKLRTNTLYITTKSLAPETYTNLPPYKLQN